MLVRSWSRSAFDTFRDRLKYHRLARFCGSDDQCALSLAQRIEQVDHTVRVIALSAACEPAFDLELFIGMLRGESAELRAVYRVVGRSAIYGINTYQRRALAAAGRVTRFSYNFITSAQPVPLDEFVADEYVVLACEITGFALTQEGGAVADDLKDT